ncbi:MAG: hypothetical protein J6T01_04105 [Kiritimatiellae bacterium]|nr:hypothetical protein [Kiritimatiellia bacterium]
MTGGVSFARTEFRKLLKASTASVVVWFLMLVSDSIIVGHLISTDAIAGIGVVIPFVTTGFFFSSLIACGAAILFSRHQGAFDSRRAATATRTAFAAAAVTGALLAGTMYLIRDAYFDWVGIGAAVRVHAASYWRWQTAILGIMPVSYLIEHLVTADGDESASIMASVGNVVFSVTLSFAFVLWTKSAGGAALGALIGTLVDDAIEASHLWKATNGVSFRPGFDFGEFREILTLGLVDALVYVFWAAALAILNAFTVAKFGERYLPVVAIAFEALQISVVFDGIGEAYKPVAGMYAGEGNAPALRSLTRDYFRLALGAGAVCGAVCFLAAPVMPAVFDIDDAAVAGEVTVMFRWVSLAMPLMSVLLMMTSTHLVAGRVLLPVAITFLKDFAAIAALPVLFGLIAGGDAASGVHAGMGAMWAGFPAGFVISLAAVLVAVKLLRPDRFPWLLPDDDGSTLNISLAMDTADSVVTARDRAAAFLGERGIGRKDVVKAMLVIEETLMLTLERNRGSRTVAEISVSVKNGSARLVTRDTGRISDVALEDTPDSFRAVFVNAMMQGIVGFSYLATLNCNRCEYIVART